MKKVRPLEPRQLKDLPEYCDFSCRYAAFAPPEISGACRREQAVHCTLAREWNGKHARCRVRVEREKTP